MLKRRYLILTLSACLYGTGGCGNTASTEDDKDPPECMQGGTCEADMATGLDMPGTSGDMAPGERDMSMPVSADMRAGPADMSIKLDMNITDDMDMSTVVVDMSQPVDMSMPMPDMRMPDMSTTPADMSMEDMSAGPVYRTLADWRRCRSNSDCPVGLGGCVKEADLNRPDAGRTAVAMSEIFTELSPGEGVCSFVCTSDENICQNLTMQGTTPDPEPHVCQLVFTGESPYPEPAPAFPFADQLSAAGMVAGRPFAAICRPPFGMDPSIEDSFCAPCMGTADCGGQALCWDGATNQEVVAGMAEGVCLSVCQTNSQCPLGNSCQPVGNDSYCVPDSGTCNSCRDRDGDGRGDGRCGSALNPVTAYDCNDADAGVYFDPVDPLHPFPLTCGEQDRNCNGLSDATEQVGTQRYPTQHCEACFESCSGPVPNAVKTCVDRLDAGGQSAPLCVPQCATDAGGNPTHVDCNGDITDGCETAVSDPTKIFYPDRDNDGFGDISQPTFDCGGGLPADISWVQNTQDCNDADGNIKPGAAEICDGVDNNCSGTADDSVAEVGQACADSGLTGVCKPGTLSCQGMAGLRCDANIAPNTQAEVCDGQDNDCDGQTDEEGATPADQTAWVDADSDGYGLKAGSYQPNEVIYFCAGQPLPAGYVQENTDCNDDRLSGGLINPGRQEDCNTPADDNCNGQLDEPGALNQKTFKRDKDGDKYSAMGVSAVTACAPPSSEYVEMSTLFGQDNDCNDELAAQNPGAVDPCNGIDDDCSGAADDDPAFHVTYYVDADGDGHGDLSRPAAFCSPTAPAGYTLQSNDCNDMASHVKPNHPEVCDGVDNDCNPGTVTDLNCPLNGGALTYSGQISDGNFVGKTTGYSILKDCPAGQFLKADWRYANNIIRPAIGATTGNDHEDFWLMRIFLTCGALTTQAHTNPGTNVYSYTVGGQPSNHGFEFGGASRENIAVHGNGGTSCFTSQAVTAINLFAVNNFSGYINGISTTCDNLVPPQGVVNGPSMMSLAQTPRTTPFVGVPGRAINGIAQCPAGKVAVGISGEVITQTLYIGGVNRGNHEHITGLRLRCITPAVRLVK